MRFVIPVSLLIVAGAAACTGESPTDTTPATPVGLFGDSSAAFAIATRPAELTFPRDHGAHPDYRTEWWYFTGNLDARDGRHFGFQLTFFRFALNDVPIERESAWATNQIWMAHFTITDPAGDEFHVDERYSRGAFNMAGATAAPFQVWLDDWSAEQQGQMQPDGSLPLRLTAATDAVSLDLILIPGKPVILQGEDGYDAKGPEPGNASYYFSQSRMNGSGVLRLRGQAFDVTGTAWMDREWSTSMLGTELVGWDWFGLQLDDGSELMLYRLRRADDTTSPFSGGSLISRAGEVARIGSADFELVIIDKWHSPATGAVYPVAWRIDVPGHALTLEVTPYLDRQELNRSVRYWEGAMRVAGRSENQPVTGSGYVELVGY